MPIRTAASSRSRLTIQRCRVIDTPSASCYYPRSNEISFTAYSENRGLRDWAQVAWHEEICHGASARTAAHMQPHMHRLWANSRILHVAQGHDELGRLSWRRQTNATHRWFPSAAANRLSIRTSKRWSDGLLAQRRIVYICTNAMFMRKKMREWMASQVSIRSEFVDEKISALRARDC